MPGRDFYIGHDLPDALRMMAEHHAAEETRHISTFEYELIHRAANAIEDASSSPSSDSMSDET